VKKDDNPIPDFVEIMGASGVGMQDSKMPFPAARMKHRKPSLRFGIETFRRNKRQNSARDF